METATAPTRAGAGYATGEPSAYVDCHPDNGGANAFFSCIESFIDGDQVDCGAAADARN